MSGLRGIATPKVISKKAESTAGRNEVIECDFIVATVPFDDDVEGLWGQRVAEACQCCGNEVWVVLSYGEGLCHMYANITSNVEIYANATFN